MISESIFMQLVIIHCIILSELVFIRSVVFDSLLNHLVYVKRQNVVIIIFQVFVD